MTSLAVSLAPWALARIRRDYPHTDPESPAALAQSLRDVPYTEFRVLASAETLTIAEATLHLPGLTALDVHAVADPNRLYARVLLTSDPPSVSAPAPTSGSL